MMSQATQPTHAQGIIHVAISLIMATSVVFLLTSCNKTSSESSAVGVGSADRLTPQEQYRLGTQYGNGDGVDHNANKARSLISKSAEGGHPEAQYELGLAYGNGNGIDHDAERAKTWLQRAANKGHTQAEKLIKDFKTPIATTH